MRTIAAAGRLRARLDQSVDEHKLQLKKVNRELKSEIADRMLAEEALRVSEERLRALNDFAPIGILLTNIEGECIYANAEWQAISGLNLEESLGGGWMQSIHPEAREVVLGGLSASSKEELKFVHECRLVDSEGGEHWVCFRSAAMHSDSGDLTGHVGTVVDLTERKRAEEELKRQEDMLLQSEKLAAIGELASGVAHELNQPLNHINITCQLIGKMLSRGIRETDDLPAELSVIEENIQRAAAIVRGMREFSRKEISGNEPIDVRKAIENAVMMFGSQLRTKNIKLSIDAPDHPVVAIGSTNRLGQVLVNLITNARDALEECDDGRRKEISIG
ncbi:PAS domain S-box protein, partial [bacterium]|nr:PAS domain S-box protein [bacterium]